MIRKSSSTFFLKAVLVLIATAVLALCVFWMPGVARRNAAADPNLGYLRIPFLVCVYVLAVPFFAALYRAFQLLTYIDRSNAFSALSVRALGGIKGCAISISALIAAAIVFVMAFVDGDRAGIIMLGLMCAFASSVVATFAAVLQRLLQEAIAIKSENDLTI